MVFPDYVTTRAVTAGGAFTLESADLLKVRLTVTASKSLVRDENGVRFERRPLTATSELGSEVSIALPVTDQAGWRDAGTGQLIDVSAPDSFTHKYTALLELIDDQGRVLAGGQVRLGPFVVPTGDLTPIDLDKTIPTSTVAGEQVAVPDLWGQLVAAAAEYAEQAASAADLIEPALGDISDLKTKTTTGYLSEAGLSTTIGDAIDEAFGSGSGGLGALEAAAKVGAGWFAKATSQPATVDIPVITVVPVADTTLPTGAIIKPLRQAGDATKVDKAGDTHFFHSGSPNLSSNSLDGTNYVIADWLPLGQPANRFYVIREDFLTEATSVVEIRVKPGATSMGFRVSVGGKWVTVEAQRFSGLTANAEYRIILTFPTARVRWITWEGASRVTTFGGVVVPAGQSVKRFQPAGVKFGILADSFGGGAGSPPDGAGYIETFPNFLAKLIGAGELRNFSYGGSGFVASDAPYSTRLAAVLEYAPDVLVVSGSRNDGSNPAGLYQAVVDVLSALDSVPLVYVTGPSTSAFSATNETVRAATLAVAATRSGMFFIDGIEQGWVQSPADFFLESGQYIHPNFEGHKKIAKGLYANIGQVSLAAAGAAPVVGDPTTTILTSSSSPTQGSPVTLTATVTPSGATGTVEFKDGSTVLGTTSASSGVATLVTSGLTAGARTLTAKFQPSTTDYATSTGVLSVTVLAPSMLSPGTLAYWQGSAQPTGLPANNENIPNLAQAQAAAIIGSGDATTLGFNHVVSGEAAGILVRERTPKGGYHVAMSQTNAANTDSGSAVSAGIDLKTLINTYLVSNPTHQFAFSAWIRETRAQAGTALRVTQQIAHLTSPSANFLTLIGQSPRPLSTDAKRLAYRETGAPQDLAPISQAMVVDGFSGTVPSASNLRPSLAVWGNKGGLNTVAPRGQGPSFVLYEFALEDLSVAGAHTMSEFLAIDLARFNEAFGAGGRYAGDTVMDVATVVP